jgi:glycosyltransferase involved in cell wall biosynthesis
MENVRVSIVIPMYNASQYIIDTLESVRGQTYREWELLVVDDGSGDSSVAKVQEYISEHQDIARLLFHPNRENRGTSASRNLGLKYANGELICFLDADDVWEPNYLDYFVKVFSSYPEVSMAYAPALYWHMNHDHAVDYVQQLGVKVDGIYDCSTLFKLFLIGYDTVPSPSGVMIKNSILSRVGGWEEYFSGMYDDQVLYSKLLLSGISVYVADQCLYKYRQHNESLCKKALKENKNIVSRMKYLEWLKQYLMQKKQLSEDLGIIIAEQMWYMQRLKEIEQFPSVGRWRQKIGTLGSLLTFLLNQRKEVSAIKLLRHIIGQQVVNLAGTINSVGCSLLPLRKTFSQDRGCQ